MAVDVAAGALEQIGARPASWPRPARGPRGPARCPTAYCSQQPRLPHSHRRPSGTTCMCPNSPATPNRPRCSVAVDDHRAADAGAEVDADEVGLAATGAEPPLGPDGGVGVVLDDDRQPQPRADRVAQRLVAPGQVRREQHVGAARRRRSPAAPMPTAWISCRSASSSTASTIVSSTTCGLLLRSGVSRRTWSRTSPSCVDDAGGDLGAADVDADGEQRGVQRADPQGAAPTRPAASARAGTAVARSRPRLYRRPYAGQAPKTGSAGAAQGVGYCRRSAASQSAVGQHPARADHLRG